MKFLEDELPESQIGGSLEKLQSSLEFQRNLFHSQVDQLQRIVVKQCKLTGVNPLSQEMAAGALSIRIGKRPRDLLNPKAVKYMQSVFSIKDAVSKKECREISALFGVSVTQVREFFASQRTRVRKLVRLSREKVIRANECSVFEDGVPTTSDSVGSVDPIPLNTINPTTVDETPTCSSENDVLLGLNDLDKQFVESIFCLMRKEETFSGQVKLMEWILQIQNSAVLFWFLSKGGSVILATWLTDAATEEQTSVLLVILQVLHHLPLNKAFPLHMSAVLQSVNRLRFYKSSDISNRARVLLSKWSKSLARSQALKKQNGAKSAFDEQQELILKQSISDVIGDESWHSSIDTPENLLDSSDDVRKSEPTQVLKLLPACSDDSNKKNILGVSSQNRERRKVQLVEQPGQKTAGRSPQAAKAAQLNQSRPMSADDIQKAKLRAQFMQSKYRKHSESNENKRLKTEVPNKPSTSQVGILPPGSKVLVRPEEHKKPVTPPLKSANVPEVSLDSKARIDLKESLLDKCRRVQILWYTPPEFELKHSWSVCAGENSKEVDIQRNRNRREKEIFYQKIQEIPPNPKEPWDLEMDYDDTLTPIIPAEQLPEGESMEIPAAPNTGASNEVTSNQRETIGSVSTSQGGNLGMAEPDLELLAVLLKNPELVFALTSGQASNLSAADTVKLLDMIKTGGGGNASTLTGTNKQVEKKVEVSLPSPTPPSNPGTSGWKPEAIRNPFSQVHRAAGNPSAATNPSSAPHVAPSPQPPIAIPPPTHHYTPPQVTSMVHEKYTPLGSSLHQKVPLTSSSTVQTNLYPSRNAKQALISSATNSHNSEERFHISNASTPSLPLAPSLSQAPQQHSSDSYQQAPAHSKEVGKPSSDFWRARQGLPSNYNNQPSFNQNSSFNNPVPFGGPVPVPPQPHRLVADPQWEGNEYAEREDFESWSPDHSPSRNSEYAMMGRNFPEPRVRYRPDEARVRYSSNSGYRDHNRYENRRWRDRRR